MRSNFRERSRALIEVGYFLARFTEVRGEGKKTLPPRELGVGTWKGAFERFHSRLSGGRPIDQFRNALKNTRDEFDGYFDNGREGWKESDGRPKKLNQKPHEVYEEFETLERPIIWIRIRKYL